MVDFSQVKKNINELKKFEQNPAPMLNTEQVFLQQLFGSGGRVMLPDTDSLPPATINGALTPNRFSEFENPEPNSEDLFGLRKKFRGTAGLFGLG